MATKKLEQKRQAVRDKLAEIVKSGEIVNVLMSPVHRQSGTARMSLKPKGGQSILYDENEAGKGFIAQYVADDGKRYEIRVYYKSGKTIARPE